MDGDPRALPVARSRVLSARRPGSSSTTRTASASWARTGRGTLEHFDMDSDDVPVLDRHAGQGAGTFGAFVAGSRDLSSSCCRKPAPTSTTTALPQPVAASNSRGAEAGRRGSGAASECSSHRALEAGSAKRARSCRSHIRKRRFSQIVVPGRRKPRSARRRRCSRRPFRGRCHSAAHSAGGQRLDMAASSPLSTEAQCGRARQKRFGRIYSPAASERRTQINDPVWHFARSVLRGAVAGDFGYASIMLVRNSLIAPAQATKEAAAVLPCAVSATSSCIGSTFRKCLRPPQEARSGE